MPAVTARGGERMVDSGLLFSTLLQTYKMRFTRRTASDTYLYFHFTMPHSVNMYVCHQRSYPRQSRKQCPSWTLLSDTWEAVPQTSPSLPRHTPPHSLGTLPSLPRHTASRPEQPSLADHIGSIDRRPGGADHVRDKSATPATRHRLPYSPSRTAPPVLTVPAARRRLSYSPSRTPPPAL